MSFYHNDWCTYNNDVVTINTYDDYACNDSYLDALTTQARCIDSTRKNLAMFISGGIDSQSKALGFINAGIPIEFVTVKHTYNGKSNDIDLFYAIAFCKKHKVELTIYEVNYTRQSLQELVLESNYLHSPIGSGIMFQLDAVKKFVNETGKHVVTSHGHFSMERDGNECSGHFTKPAIGKLIALNMENTIVFDMYAPYVFKYYEHVHRSNIEIQLLNRYEAKNLSFTELGMPLRPKLSSWEFLCTGDYSKLTTLNWADSDAKTARLPNIQGLSVISDALGIEGIERYSDSKWKTPESRVELYSFKTNYQFPY
jgi:hypothetical protein